jgi:hypothetical protein
MPDILIGVLKGLFDDSRAEPVRLLSFAFLYPCLSMIWLVHLIEIRYLSLHYKFMLESLSKGPSFALYYARKANESRSIAKSVFI